MHTPYINVKVIQVIKLDVYKIKKLSFDKNSNFLISLSLQPDDLNLWYLKLRLFDITNLIVWKIGI